MLSYLIGIVPTFEWFDKCIIIIIAAYVEAPIEIITYAIINYVP